MNCWEFMSCPRDTYTACPAYPDQGQDCWKLTGTNCAQGRMVKPTVREKTAFCWTCNYYINYANRHRDGIKRIDLCETPRPRDLGQDEPPAL